MFVAAEITRLEEISDPYIPTLYPFVVSFKFYYGAANEDIATFWSSTFSVTEPLTLRTFITGVVYNVSTNYSKKTTLVDCLSDDQSFFWDNTNQVLYIHYNQDHQIDQFTFNFDYGIAIGLTNDRIRYFENRPYYPYLLNFPQIEVLVDKLNYDQLSFIVDTISTDNRTGFFNQFKTVPIYGNQITIRTGEEGDSYVDLVERATYYIEDYNFSADTFDIDIQDVRKTLTAQVPNTILSIADYPDLGEHSIGKTLPFLYTPYGGFSHDVPGHCINEEDLIASDPKFKFAEVLTVSSTADISVWVLSSDQVWIEDTGISIDEGTGLVTVPDAKTGASPYGVLQVKADCRGVLNTYASDIIKDLYSRFLSLTYDSSNYDIVEWETEEVFLAPVSLYMKTTKDIYEWIRELQSLSTVGFRHTTSLDNRKTIRVDNPNRSVTVTVPAIHIRNVPEVVAESNREDVYNKIYIGYNKALINDNYAVEIES